MRAKRDMPFRVMFVCFGNICRSPMAEALFLDAVRAAGREDDFEAASAATGCEEGRPVHPGTVRVLAEHGKKCPERRSVLLRAEDAEKYDLFVGMDGRNLRAMRRILGEDAAGKIHALMDFTPSPREVADPWETGDFDATYRDVSEGVAALVGELIGEEKDETKDQ